MRLNTIQNRRMEYNQVWSAREPAIRREIDRLKEVNPFDYVSIMNIRPIILGNVAVSDALEQYCMNKQWRIKILPKSLVNRMIFQKK